MSSRSFVLIVFVILLVGSAFAACPTNWTVHSRDCCSPTFGFNSSAPTFRVAQGAEFPINFIVWNDSSRNSLSIDTDWTTLNILWGERTSSESGSYGPNGLVDAVRIFHQPGKGLYGLQFHDLSGFSPVLGLATSTFIDLAYAGRPFSGWGMITRQAALLNSLSACFRMP